LGGEVVKFRDPVKFDLEPPQMHGSSLARMKASAYRRRRLRRARQRGVTMGWAITCVLACAALIGLSGRADAQQSATIEKLLSEGWEVAGYVAAWENRTLILFKHREHRYLIQCSVLIDVMRKPRVVTYCNEIR
jgi:hypothetical protein